MISPKLNLFVLEREINWWSDSWNPYFSARGDSIDCWYHLVLQEKGYLAKCLF
jgi:hypothetical protein